MSAPQAAEAPPPGKDVIRGDSNLDRTVDLSDAVTMLDDLFLGGRSLGCEDSADADGNERLEISDPILLLGVLFLGSGTIPAPYPVCGSDPAPDGLSCDEVSCGE